MRAQNLTDAAKHSAESALRDARAAWQRGDAGLAEERCRAALTADPGETSAWVLLGVVLRRRDSVAARAALAAALEREPQHADAWFHLGNLEREGGRAQEAIAAYENALRYAPDNSSLRNNLGLAYEAAGDTPRAEAEYRSVLASAPGHRQSLGNLGHLLCRLLRYPEALALCEDYLRRFADADATPWIDRGICLHHLGDYERAESSFARALELSPDDPLAMTNLGSVMLEREDFASADALLTRAVERDAANAYAVSSLAHCRAQLCAWDGLAALHTRMAHVLKSGGELVNVFATLSAPLGPELQLRAARRWADDLAPAMRRDPPRSRGQGTRLRVGYVSSDFRTHATTSLLAEVWERHDRSRLETRAYSIGPGETSPLRARIEAAFDVFTDASDESAEAIARRIAGDGIEVLIDLNGYTTHAKSELFALKPAPVQVSWLGYLGSLGAPWYDYVLTDRFAAPPELQRHFTERFLYLPECYCPSDTRRPVAQKVPTRAECGLPASAFVFCCFNHVYKILPEVFALWMRLLAQVPGSVLWLSPASATACANLRREAAARGIDPQRLVFAPRVSLPEHLARHAHADLFLDTTPYNAGTTANDALFMGVPLVTCAGQTLASRVAGSQLHAIGLPELVTTTLPEYAALALALARDPALLAGYRARLAANRHSAPLFDMARFARALDDLLHTAWENRPSSMAAVPPASV